MKKLTTTAALLCSAIAGAGVHSQIAPALPTGASPLMLRWVDNDGAAPSFSLRARASAGNNRQPHDITCEADGSGPRLDGQPFAPAADICATIAKFGSAMVVSTGKLAPAIADPAAKH